MTGLTVLRQAYCLLGQETQLPATDGDDAGLTAVNQIYSELWQRERREPFLPLERLQQKLTLSAAALPAMAYGTAMLLCLDEAQDGNYVRWQELYDRAAGRVHPPATRRLDVLFRGVPDEE